MPTIAFIPNLGPEMIHTGNYGMQNPLVNLIFSGSYWTDANGNGPRDEGAMLAATRNILTGPYLTGLTQYGSDGRATFGRSWEDSATVSNSGVDSLQTFLSDTITNHLAAPGNSDLQHAAIYVVISDPASSHHLSRPDALAWNSPGTYLQLGQPLHMIWVGTALQAGDIILDDFTTALSHELAETLSDPDSLYGNGTVIAPTDHSSGPPGQIADYEASYYKYRLGGDLVQAYWSERDQTFIVPDGNKQTFYVDPINPIYLSYGLRIEGDQLGVNYQDQILIDQTTDGALMVTLNGEVARFAPHLIANVYVDTGGGSDSVTETPAASTVPLTRIVGPPTSLATAANVFTHSAEYYGNLIRDAYSRYLGRSPDPSELANWIQAMQAGFTDEQLEAAFIGSPEYIQNHGGTGQAWVVALYRDLLGRDPDAKGLQRWLDALANGASPSQIAYGFAASPEREAQRITADYQKFLGRDPEQGILPYWIDAFTHDASNEAIVASLVSSPEYFKRHYDSVRHWLSAAYQDVLGRSPDQAGYESWLNVLGTQDG